MTRQELLDALTVERFGQPVPEWHNERPCPDEARALRLVVDREAGAA